MKIIKRDSSVVDFDRNKIEKAILKAMNELDMESKNIAKAISIMVEDSFKGELVIHIEDIQDEVEDTLISNGYKDLAKHYIVYREKRSEIRNQQSKMYEKMQQDIDDILSMKNIENSNANVDESSFSGKKQRATDALMKDYALNKLMDKVNADAHRNSEIYIHDLSEYASGMHNCLVVDFDDLFTRGGFETRNGDVRRPNDIMTFFQLVAVVFQCQSQVQFGGVSSGKIDYEAAPYVSTTFKKSYKNALMDKLDYTEEMADKYIEENKDIIKLENKKLKEINSRVYDIAYRHTYKKTLQGAESLYHNLNTLESRAGSQVPFTSINFGTDTSPEGRMVSECILKASLSGIGQYNRTSIFPISIFKHMKGVNDIEGTPNYDLKQLAIKSLSKRIYPNIVNVDAPHLPKPTSPVEEHCTMGCRTQLGVDRHGLKGHGGRGNISPATINLVDLGIKYGICLGTRDRADIEGFLNDLDNKLTLTEKILLDRYKWQCSQMAKSAQFMYHNQTMKSTLGRKLNPTESVHEVLKHSTLAMGYIGLAECMKALFGKHHGEDEEIYNFAYSIIERISNFAKEASERNDLNFSGYATPAESLCHTFAKALRHKYGVIDGVTDKEFITNSHHIPVYYSMSIFEKIDKEAPFAKLATGGYICYVELESSIANNPKAIEKIINYAMDKGLSYMAINFPIDTCLECGFSGEMNESCHRCKSTMIQRLRRVTGYLTTDYSNFNNGKIDEVHHRVKHSKFTNTL